MSSAHCTTGLVAFWRTSGIASVPSTSRSCWTEAQWLIPPTTGGIAIWSADTPASPASHSALPGCPVHEHSANVLTEGAARRIAIASVGAGLV